MDSTDQPCREEDRVTVADETKALAAIASELGALVDRLELGGAGRQVAEIADQVHRLRKRAEQLFGEA